MRKALPYAPFGRTGRARLRLLAGMRQRSDAVISCVGSNPRRLEMTLRALKGHFAAEASALDLRLTEDRRSLDAIRAGMDKYAVLVFRDQLFFRHHRLAAFRRAALVARSCRAHIPAALRLSACLASRGSGGLGQPRHDALRTSLRQCAESAGIAPGNDTRYRDSRRPLTRMPGRHFQSPLEIGNAGRPYPRQADRGGKRARRRIKC